MIAADTITNSVYALANENGIDTPEQFAIDVCQTHLDTYTQVSSCKAYVEEMPWRRMDILGVELNSAFINTPEAVRFAEVQQNRDDSSEVFSGFKTCVS
ncbi:uricase-like [Amphiura filiformis]|uniref:uricase-like n=1 Tax=Amphiura filiformis TaxID=82378 RepID=UPI003B21378D